MSQTTMDVQRAAGALMDETGPATLASVMAGEDERVSRGLTAHLRPMATGFDPLDDVLGGGIRPGELLIIGGPYGVGKTIWGLQLARNVASHGSNDGAMYVCYEHDRSHLMMRLMCLESAFLGHGEEALTLRKISALANDARPGEGLMARMRREKPYAAVVDAIESYAERLVLVRASGDYTTLDEIRRWGQDQVYTGHDHMLMVVDYLQKIPPVRAALGPEVDVTTHLAQGLKEMAMSLGIQVAAISASDREGLKSSRMKLSDMRGSSAIQYESDIGLMLNNKYAIVSREHLVYNPVQAQAMRNWVVLTVEKNRAGRAHLDMEFKLDAGHFRIEPVGDMVRERLIDDKVVAQ
ncbi:MAG: DnaB-like helicase C-terminal domain-containing protein [Anaerolineae bacterium]